MPWSIQKQGSKWCVIADKDGRNMGCHPTEAEAREQQKALYAQEKSPKGKVPVTNSAARLVTLGRLAAVDRRVLLADKPGQKHSPKDGKYTGSGGSGGGKGRMEVGPGAQKDRAKRSAAESRKMGKDIASAPAAPKGWAKGPYRDKGHVIRKSSEHHEAEITSSRDGKHHWGEVRQKGGKSLWKNNVAKPTRQAAIKETEGKLAEMEKMWGAKRASAAPATPTVVNVTYSGQPVSTTLNNLTFTATSTGAPPVAFEAAPEEEPLPSRWRGPLAAEGISTDDGRMFAPGALDWRDFPLPLAWQRENRPGHEGAVVVARIDYIERVGDRLLGHGTFDLGSPEGREAARQVRDGFLRGVSVDVSVDDGAMTVDEMEDGRMLTVFSSGRVLGATLCPLPAFAQAFIEPWDGAGQSWDGLELGDGLAAASSLRGPRIAVSRESGAGPASEPGDIPVAPPAAWFENPSLTGPTALSITEDGRVLGHLALWDSCHTSFGEGAGQCVRPPRSATGYAYFRTGELMTAEGDLVPVGHLTVGARHAPLRDANGAPVSGPVALEHYEHSGWVGADVVAGEDDHGIWVAGALRPGLSGEQLRELRAAPLSGDWRRIGGSLELIGALAVNVPGFPVRRAAALMAGGVPQAFIAAPAVRAAASSSALDAVAERIASTVGLDRPSRLRALEERVGI